MEAYMMPWQKYAQFDGRSGRKEYWTFVLGNFAVFVILGILGYFVGSLIGIVSMLFSLAALVPSIAVGIRRLHDIGKSGWWMLIVLIPFLGALVFIVLMLMGSAGDNQYGAPPA